MVASCAGLNAEICNKKGKETLMTITVTHASFCFYLSGLRLTSESEWFAFNFQKQKICYIFKATYLIANIILVPKT